MSTEIDKSDLFAVREELSKRIIENKALRDESKSANETLQKISGCLCYGCRAGKAVDLINSHFMKFPTKGEKN